MAPSSLEETDGEGNLSSPPSSPATQQLEGGGDLKTDAMIMEEKRLQEQAEKQVAQDRKRALKRAKTVTEEEQRSEYDKLMQLVQNCGVCTLQMMNRTAYLISYRL